MPVLRALIAATILLLGTPWAASADPPPERWVSTWAAPAVARVDQPAQALSAAAQAFPWAKDVPASVRDATPGQELDIGGGSALHFKDQTAPPDRPCVGRRSARAGRAGEHRRNAAPAGRRRAGRAPGQGFGDHGRLQPGP